MALKFCKFCGEQIDEECVVCPKCGKQVEKLGGEDKQQIIINNSASAAASAATTAAPIYAPMGKKCNKWVSLALCILGGFIGAHKFYEGKGGMGVLYCLTVGLFGIGIFIDAINILCKPNPYYVY